MMNYKVILIPRYQGLGIALVAAQKTQIPVTLVDSSQASLDNGLKFAGPLAIRPSRRANLTRTTRQTPGKRRF